MGELSKVRTLLWLKEGCPPVSAAVAATFDSAMLPTDLATLPALHLVSVGPDKLKEWVATRSTNPDVHAELVLHDVPAVVDAVWSNRSLADDVRKTLAARVFADDVLSTRVGSMLAWWVQTVDDAPPVTDQVLRRTIAGNDWDLLSACEATPALMRRSLLLVEEELKTPQPPEGTWLARFAVLTSKTDFAGFDTATRRHLLDRLASNDIIRLEPTPTTYPGQDPKLILRGAWWWLNQQRPGAFIKMLDYLAAAGLLATAEDRPPFVLTPAGVNALASDTTSESLFFDVIRYVNGMIPHPPKFADSADRTNVKDLLQVLSGHPDVPAQRIAELLIETLPAVGSDPATLNLWAESADVFNVWAVNDFRTRAASAFIHRNSPDSTHVSTLRQLASGRLSPLVSEMLLNAAPASASQASEAERHFASSHDELVDLVAAAPACHVHAWSKLSEAVASVLAELLADVQPAVSPQWDTFSALMDDWPSPTADLIAMWVEGTTGS